MKIAKEYAEDSLFLKRVCQRLLLILNKGADLNILNNEGHSGTAYLQYLLIEKQFI